MSEKKYWMYYVDIAGACNLRCPSCPVGNAPSTEPMTQARGFMSKELFCSILDKIIEECPSNPALGVYNWTEPTLHPELPEFIAEAKKRGFYVNLSTNANTERDWRPILRSGVDDIVISMSGTREETYGWTHARGNVNLVMSNMYRIAHYLQKEKLKVNIFINFLAYKNNMEDLKEVEELTKKLGFYEFRVLSAVLLPVQKMVAHHDGKPLSEQDQKIVDNMLVPFKDLYKIWDNAQLSGCSFQDEQTAIDFQGRVSLCCMTYGEESIIAPSFLEIGHEDLQQLKHKNSLCTDCFRVGVPAMVGHMASEPMKKAIKHAIAENS